jgi:hypothetical protein
MRAEINKVIAMCLACQQVKQRHLPRLGVAGIMSFQSREIIHLDHFINMPEDVEGHNEILAIKNRFLKQVLLEATKKLTARRLLGADCRMPWTESVIFWNVIITYNGIKFQGNLIAEASKNGVQVIQTFRYHPNSNGEATPPQKAT